MKSTLTLTAISAATFCTLCAHAADTQAIHTDDHIAYYAQRIGNGSGQPAPLANEVNADYLGHAKTFFYHGILSDSTALSHQTLHVTGGTNFGKRGELALIHAAFSAPTVDFNVTDASLTLTNVNAPLSSATISVDRVATQQPATTLTFHNNALHIDQSSLTGETATVRIHTEATSTAANGNTLEVSDSTLGTALVVEHQLPLTSPLPTGTMQASGNMLTLNRSQVNAWTVGVQSVSGLDTLALASDNTVTVTDSQVNEAVIGAMTQSVAVADVSPVANTQRNVRNHVTLHNSHAGFVIGALANLDTSLQTTHRYAINVSNNTVTVSADAPAGSTVRNHAATTSQWEGNVIGALTMFHTATEVDKAQATMAYNTVNLVNANVANTVYAAAYHVDGEFTGINAPQSGNTIHASGVNRVGAIDGFSDLTLTVGAVNATDAVLTLTSDKNQTLTDKTIRIEADHDAKADTVYKLIAVAPDAGTVTINNTTLEHSGTFMATRTVLENTVLDATHPLDYSFQAEALPEPTPEPSPSPAPDVTPTPAPVPSPNSAHSLRSAAVLSNAVLGSLALVHQGGDLIANDGMRMMKRSATLARPQTFAAVSANASRYKTHGNLDLKGSTLATGVVTTVGDGWLAGFVETGTANSQSRITYTHGNADHSYYGLGFAARLPITAMLNFDASLRLGKTETSFDGHSGSGRANFDANGLYAGGHIALSQAFHLTSRTDLTLYAGYTLDYLQGDTVGLGTRAGERLHYDDTILHTLEAGMGLSHQLTEHLTWQSSLAYARTLDAEVHGRIQAPTLGSARLSHDDLAGQYGLMQVGLSMTPSASSPWQFDVNLRGYAGNRQGVSGNASLLYRF